MTDHLGYGDVDLIRTRWDSLEVVHGDRTAWNQLAAFFRSRIFVEDGTIEELGRQFDLEDFTNLQALVHATQYDRWSYGAALFRERSADGTWRWTVWDADRAFNAFNWNGFTAEHINPMSVELDELILQPLFRNASYRRFYANRVADLLNTVFRQENVLSVIDSLKLLVAPEIPKEVARWGNSAEKWDQFVGHLRTFAVRRPGILRQQVVEHFQFEGEAEVAVSIAGGSGQIRVNDLTLDHFPWVGTYFSGNPITVEAVPAPGFRFHSWSDSDLPDTPRITVDPGAGLELTAALRGIAEVNAELIAPSRVRPGQHFPFAVRLRDAEGGINPVEQTPMQVQFGAAREDSVIKIKRGAGTGVVWLDSPESFDLTVQNDAVPQRRKRVTATNRPEQSYAGILPTGDVVWDDTVDHMIDGDITVPADTRLIIRPGTWVLVGKFVNFQVEGEVRVEGTADNPVVITSQLWSEPWGGMVFDGAIARFRHCIVLNGGGDLSKGFWHTGHQHIFFGERDAYLDFDHCYFLNSPGKVFGAADSRARITNSVSSFVYHGGEFFKTLLFYQDSHLMNLPNDDGIYTEDIDTDGLHIDFINDKYPEYSVIDRCYFVTGKDDAIDHQAARLRVSNCWLEDFEHEGVAASWGDTVRIFNTVAIDNDQGFEAGYTRKESSGPFVFIDHSVAVNNNVGLRIGDSYNWDAWTYDDRMTVTNSVIYGNETNIWNHVFLLEGPLEGALEISNSMTNDPAYDGDRGNVGVAPEFDPFFYLVDGSFGSNLGTHGTAMGRIDSTDLATASIVINEIMFRSAEVMDTGDWVELYNPRSVAVDVSGWTLSDDDDEHIFAIPDGTVIPTRAFLIVARDADAFAEYHPQVADLVGGVTFGFGADDQVRLFDRSGSMVDAVSYSRQPPWTAADGTGFSMALIDPHLDNGLADNWQSSDVVGGTPGRDNSPGLGDQVEPAVTNVAGEVSDAPPGFGIESNYPNPFSASTHITYSIPDPGTIRLVVFNALGQRVAVRDEPWILSPGRHRIDFSRNDLSAGIYFYQLQFTSTAGKRLQQAGKFAVTR